MVINCGTEGETTRVENANVAIFTCSLAASETETKGVVTLNSADQLLAYSQAEEKVLLLSMDNFFKYVLVLGHASYDSVNCG